MLDAYAPEWVLDFILYLLFLLLAMAALDALTVWMERRRVRKLQEEFKGAFAPGNLPAGYVDFGAFERRKNEAMSALILTQSEMRAESPVSRFKTSARPVAPVAVPDAADAKFGRM